MESHFKLIGSEVKDLTPDLAISFSTLPASNTERELKQKRIDYLRDRVLSGTAISFSWARATVADTGEVIRVNGHHSSSMLAVLDGNFPIGLKVHIDDYEVPNKESLALLFRQFDSRVSARSINDISGVYQGLQPALANVPKDAARAALDGAVWYLKKVVGEYVPTGDDRFDLFSRADMHPFIQMVGGIYTAKTPEFSTPVLGAMYGSWDREPTVAADFWPEVAAQGAGNEAPHPTTVLDAWLLDTHQKKVEKPKEWEVYRACVIAWNAYRNHRSLARIGKFKSAKGIPELE